MAKLVLFPYPHFKKVPKMSELANKEDIVKLIARLELLAKIRLLSHRSRARLLRELQKEGKL
tara:strand:+ start:4148 stop:4333 length:186 start_codon:yes stop_codon:yes gene_type:complete